jgi:heme-binding protein
MISTMNIASMSHVHSSKELQMFSRSAIGVGMIAAAMLFGPAATAVADPPNCTAADLAGVMSGVSAGTSAYLFTHPDVNAFFTGLKGKPRDQMTTEIQGYMDANPQVRDELRNVRAAAGDFRARCNAPLPPDRALPDMPMG